MEDNVSENHGGNPFPWEFSEPDLLRFYPKNQADVHLNAPGHSRYVIPFLLLVNPGFIPKS